MIQHLEIAGRHLNSFLNRILFEKGYKFTTPLELISEIKENLCIVRPETKFEPKEIDFKVHPLPDDSIVRLKIDTILEIIFAPKLINLEKDSYMKLFLKVF